MVQIHNLSLSPQLRSRAFVCALRPRQTTTLLGLSPWFQGACLATTEAFQSRCPIPIQGMISPRPRHAGALVGAGQMILRGRRGSRESGHGTFQTHSNPGRRERSGFLCYREPAKHSLNPPGWHAPCALVRWARGPEGSKRAPGLRIVRNPGEPGAGWALIRRTCLQYKLTMMAHANK
jgi:hypothetical protein